MLNKPTVDCARLRESYALEDLVAEARRRLPGVAAAPVDPDQSHPGLARIDAATAAPTELGLIRELRTARAYAAFVRERRGETFVHASRFRGAFVPVFDGFVLGAGGPAVRNVSLKFDALSRARPTARALLNSLRSRLDLAVELRKAGSLARWLAAVNTRAPPVDGRQRVRDRDLELDRALTLWVTFGLRERGRARPFVTVVDMSESGFTHDFVGDETVTREIRALAPPGGLTLIWDHARALEF